jgi:AraC-like DNA-binding protein
VLRPGGSGTENEHERLLPSATLAPYVAHFWWVRWDLAEPRTAETLPHPTVHIVFDSTARAGEVTGVQTKRFVCTLAGRGRVFGIKFRPATFEALYGRPMAQIRDKTVSITEALGALGEELSAAVYPDLGFDAAIDRAEAVLGPRLGPLPPPNATVRDLVERMATDQTILRVEQAAAIAGVEARTLERWFRRLVGVSPKWVIRRYRLLEAVERLKATDGATIAALSAELGYFDQSHFVRDFKAVIGQPPAAFLRSRG